MAMVVKEAAAGNQEIRKYAGKVVVSSKHCLYRHNVRCTD